MNAQIIDKRHGKSTSEGSTEEYHVGLDLGQAPISQDAEQQQSMKFDPISGQY
eukprot:SAG31_NODE_2640_length_5324_cov_5.437835_2_plen_53_part_00